MSLTTCAIIGAFAGIFLGVLTALSYRYRNARRAHLRWVAELREKH